MAANGKIEVIFGPMFSGKSTELIRRIRRHTIAKNTCMVIKYAKDDRYSVSDVSTHDRQTLESTPCNVLADTRARAMQCDVIGIDEGQFFPDIVAFSEEMANLGKIMIIAALDGTFQRKPFNDILQLVPLAEDVVKLSAICSGCHKDGGAFSYRLSGDTRLELIGGSESYISLCRGCLNERETKARRT